MELIFFSSAFCEPCMQTRAVLAEAEGIRTTPTVIVKNAAGTEVFRAAGVPTLAQVLVAAAKAL